MALGRDERALRSTSMACRLPAAEPLSAMLRVLLAGLALLAGAAAAEPPAAPRAAEGGLLLQALEAAPLGVVGTIETAQRARCPRLARRRRRRVGAHRPGRDGPLVIAWEELASARPPRFANGDRVLLALEPLSGGSLWRKRFSDPKALLAARGVAQRGRPSCAIRRSEACRSCGTTCCCRPTFAAGRPGSATSSRWRRTRSAPLALSAAHRLAGVSGESTLGVEEAKLVLRALARADSDAELASPLLIWIERRQPAGLAPALDAALARPGGCAGDLRGGARPARRGPPGRAREGAAREPVRAPARRGGGRGRPGAGRATRRSAAQRPRARGPRRRTPAARAPRGPRLPRHAARRLRRRGRSGAEGGRRARGGVRPRGRAAAARRGHALALAGLPDRRARRFAPRTTRSRGPRSSSSPISTRTSACARSPRSRSAAGSATRTRSGDARSRGLERPAPAPRGRAQRGLERRQEALARPRRRSEGGEVRRRQLTVEQREAPGRELLHQRRERRLRGVRGDVEHRLGEERGAERDAVDPAHQLAVPPGLAGVGVAQLVQGHVRLEHVRRDPGAGTPVAPHLGAGSDHAREGGVQAQLEVSLPEPPPEAPRHVQPVRLDHHARVGGEPEDRRLLVPREDAERVGEQQPLARQVGADGEQPGGLRVVGRRERQIGCAIGRRAWRPGLGGLGTGRYDAPSFSPRMQEPA